MTPFDDDYRTLKHTDEADDPYATLTPPKRAAAPKQPARPEEPPPIAEAPAPRLPPPAPERVRPAAQLAAPVCRLFPLGDKARLLLDEKQTVVVYLYRLMHERLYPDAVHLLAHALPRRDAIRWACDCVRGEEGANPAAAAVFLSGGGIAPADRPAAGEDVGARAVAEAVMSAALAAEPDRTGERYFRYLKEGIALAAGVGRLADDSA